MSLKGIGLLLSGVAVLSGWLIMLIVSWQYKQKERQMRRLEDTLPVWAQYLLGAILGFILIGFLVAMFAQIANAQEFQDNGDGTCVQSDGQAGMMNGTTADDAGCITPDEYEALHSPEGLEDAGVISDVVDNGDGTVSGTSDSWTGSVRITILSDSWARPVAANTNPESPAFETNAPTVREVWQRAVPTAFRNIAA